MNMTPSDGSLGEVIRLFVRLGFTAFGGPAAHIALMHDEVVLRRRWLSEQEFLDLVGATNLIPGPNSTEMAIHIGYRQTGWRGLLAAGLGFILPAVFIVGILAWAYVEYGATPTGDALLYGIKPVIIAIVLQALIRLGRTAVKGPAMAALGAAALALYLLGVNELVVLFGGALLVLAVQMARGSAFSASAVAPIVGLGGWLSQAVAWTPGLAQALSPGLVQLDRLFLVFLKAGALLYGSGYVLLAFLRNDLVLGYGWLTDRQLLDAIAIGQFTPGPVFTTATFVGYLLAGVPGAVLATVGIFVPSFCFVALLARVMPRLRASRWTSALLDGVNVAALGLMAGVTVQLGRAALVDLPTVLLAAGAAVLLFRYRINSAWLVLGGGIIGLVIGLIRPT